MPQKIGLTLLFGTAVVLAAWAAHSWLGRSGPRPVTGNEVTYVCLETRDVFDGPVQDIPAINPATGRRTLVRAVYSTRTNEWVPIASEEVLRQNRRLLSQTDGSSPLVFAPPEEQESK
jgi:hypothetical protein